MQVQVGRGAIIDHSNLHRTAVGEVGLAIGIQRHCGLNGRCAIQCRARDVAAGVGFRDRNRRRGRQSGLLRRARAGLRRNIAVGVGDGSRNGQRVAVARRRFGQCDDAVAIAVGVAAAVNQRTAAQMQGQIGRRGVVGHRKLYRAVVGQYGLIGRVQGDRGRGLAAGQVAAVDDAMSIVDDRHRRGIGDGGLFRRRGGGGARDVTVLIGHGGRNAQGIAVARGGFGEGDHPAAVAVGVARSIDQHTAAVQVQSQIGRRSVVHHAHLHSAAIGQRRLIGRIQGDGRGGLAAGQVATVDDAVAIVDDRNRRRIRDTSLLRGRRARLRRDVAVGVGDGGGDAQGVAVARRGFGQRNDAITVAVGVARGIDQGAAAVQMQIETALRTVVVDRNLDRATVGQHGLVGRIQRHRGRGLACGQVGTVDDTVAVVDDGHRRRVGQRCVFCRCRTGLGRDVAVDVSDSGRDGQGVAVARCRFSQRDDTAAIGVGVAAAVNQNAAAVQVQVQIGRRGVVGNRDLHRTAIGQHGLICRIQRHSCRCLACGQVAAIDDAMAVVVDRHSRRSRQGSIDVVCLVGAGAGDVAVAVGGRDTGMHVIDGSVAKHVARDADAVGVARLHRAGIALTVNRQGDDRADGDVGADRAGDGDGIAAAVFGGVDGGDRVDPDGDRRCHGFLRGRCAVL